jgi:hypothetical protein
MGTRKQKKIKTYVLDKVMSDEEIKAREGTYFDKGKCTIITHDADVYGKDPDAPSGKRLLAKFRKGVFSKDLTDLAWDAFYRAAAPSRNRGAAAGPIDLKSEYWKKRKPVDVSKWSARYTQDGKTSKMLVNNNVFSSVLGYFEATPFMKLPCRLTSYTQNYFQNYKKGIPYIQAIDQEFKHLIPDRHALQLKRVKDTPDYQIADTAFSSVTINRNFRTALHQDAGDFKDGYGNLSVIERGKYHGGETLFPQYGVGFDLRSGDFIAMDVHQWHCNTALYETPEDKNYNKTLPPVYSNSSATGTLGSEHAFTRISFVCYLREKLHDCDRKETQQYYKRIQFDPEHGSLKKRTTRRKTKTTDKTDE